ncbi:MAG: HEAT repeat domain-containing protein [Ignavibacteriaceae bacterium]
MEHQIYKEWIPLAVDNELSKHEQLEFDKHINDCVECQIEFEEQKRLKSILLEHKPEDPDEFTLFQVRQELRDAIRAERTKLSAWKKFLSSFTFLSSIKFQAAFGGVAVLAAGFFLGYIFFKTDPVQIISNPETSTMVENASDNFSFAQNDVRISNVRFIDQDAKDGEIEFIFDAIKPVRMKGNINDERIKNVLTYSMLNVENPGVRLNSINAIGTEQKTEVDAEVKAALISVAKFDDNPGVRREAIKLLSKFNGNPDVKNTLMYVLMNDKMSGNRIEAINSLMQAQKDGTKFSEDELSVFKEKMKVDENRYIRYQAKTVLEESK